MSKNKKPSASTPGFSKAEKSKRAKYLSKRLNDLYDELIEWINGIENLSFKRKNISVDGERLPSVEIYSGRKLFASIKPAGLYAFGFNCRIDIKSGENKNVLVDIARESAEPDWQLISFDAGKKPKKITKVIFRNLIKALNS
jgi:hypothetical protein